jgi:ABC-type dipeptide/oligopeptide/nickel transport system permease subunit
VSVRVDTPNAVEINLGAPAQPEAVKARGYWEGIWVRLRRDRLAIAGGCFIIFLFLAAFVGAPIAAHLLGHGPSTQYLSSVDLLTQVPAGPWTHVSTAPYAGAPGHYPTTLYILGADSNLGRDMILRLLYGAQTSLEVALLATLGSVGLGVIMGLLAGYFRGWVDTVVSRMIEIVMVFPYLLFIIALKIVAGPTLNSITLGFLKPGVFTLALILTLFGWFYPARIMRGVIFSLREKEFVEAARMTGATDSRIMRSHLLPHLVAPIVVYSSLIIATNIIAEAGLSFLGLGIPVDVPSWGNLLAEAPLYYQTQVWIMIIPGMAILLTTLAFNLLGDGLRDAFDPRSRV